MNFLNFLLIPDHTAGAFHQDPLKNPMTGDHLVEFLHGYTEGHMFAFFPLFPLAVRFTAETILFSLRLVMQLRSVLMIAGWLLNTISFTVAAVALYDLTWRVFDNRMLAHIAAIISSALNQLVCLCQLCTRRQCSVSWPCLECFFLREDIIYSLSNNVCTVNSNTL